MTDSLLVQELRDLDPEQLLGFDVQKRLSPPYRGEYDLERVKFNNPRTAAVLIMLYENEFGETCFPIMLRNEYDGPHSHEFSLPGGAFEAEDITYDQTALRETVEELGVMDDQLEILCALTELYIPPSNFLVYPFVGVYHGLPEFIPDEEEVQLVVPIDLESFLQAEPTHFAKKIKEESHNIPAYEIGEDAYIWGATAMVLEEFKQIVLSL